MSAVEGPFRRLIPYEETEPLFKAIAGGESRGPAEVIDLQKIKKTQVVSVFDFSEQNVGRSDSLSPEDWALIARIWTDLDRT